MVSAAKVEICVSFIQLKMYTVIMCLDGPKLNINIIPRLHQPFYSIPTLSVYIQCGLLILFARFSAFKFVKLLAWLRCFSVL